MFSISSRPKLDSNRQADPEPMSTATVSGRTTPTLQRKPSPSTSTSSESSGPQTPTTSTEEEPPRSRHRRQNTLTFDEEGQNPQLDFGDFETGEGIVAPSDSGHSISSANHSAMSTKSRISNSSSASTTTCKVATSPPPLEEELEEAGDADVSFEMKLDSLHFDDISFDVDRFVSD
ncbi:hypothetical protein NMY22_g7541 [Coprinellus aureogranulatus]|nr:hypothetical protein NMY22_g7541 [Coprinellus aureogranulatus]